MAETGGYFEVWWNRQFIGVAKNIAIKRIGKGVLPSLHFEGNLNRNISFQTK